MPLTIDLVCILPRLQLSCGVQSASLVQGCRTTSWRAASTQKYLKQPEPAMVGDIQTCNGISHISWQLTDSRAQMSGPGILGRTFTITFYKPDIYKHALEKQVGLSSQNSCSWGTYHGVHRSLFYTSPGGSHHRIWPSAHLKGSGILHGTEKTRKISSC